MPAEREKQHMYTLYILCPHCTRHHAITEWPRTYDNAVLFTCLLKRGGCGGKSLVEPPDVGNQSSLEDVFVTGHPLTEEQASRIELTHEPPL